MSNQTVTQASNYFDLQGLEQLRQKTKTNDKETIREVANQFESMFASMLIKSMRQANEAFETESPFNNQQTKFYTDMQDKQLAVDISRHGTLGLADALVRQLDPTSMVRPQSVAQDQLTMPNQAEQKQMMSLQPEVVNSNFKAPDQMQQSQQIQLNKSAVKGLVENSDVTAASGPHKIDFTSPSSFIETLLPYAKKAAKALGVSPEVLVAQSALETGWGKKILQTPGQESSFNLFNIKSHGGWKGESVNKNSLEVEDGVGVQRRSNFRVYQGLQESFKDYTDFISNNKRYEQALQQGDNAERYIEELQQAGYATDPKYAEKIKQIMNSNSFQSVVAGDNNG
ncbi:flagellar assembly peptidoglycan hydrolase FlgJ [uncultured Psychromonas sp.]|uniref:flagellar assembly peptidoglycan hydrolase FlgJ n=1 Tax=uncultured Psychromonas sp. TaxID=173974 RepID=UPI00260FEF34|nr:flagellar assembly peptidoglycan hydrolase FlgJ [uncultured Psychromonas sp.]